MLRLVLCSSAVRFLAVRCGVVGSICAKGSRQVIPLVSLQRQLCHLLWKERGALQLRIAELAAIDKEATL